MFSYAVPIFFLALAAFSAQQDPRKVRIGVFLMTGVFLGLLTFLTRFLNLVDNLSSNDMMSAYILLGLIILILLMILTVSLALIANGISMIKRAGTSLPHLLSLFLGIGLLLYLFLGFYSVLRLSNQVFATLLVLLGGPIAFVGFGLFSYAVYQWLYLRFAARWGGPVTHVIALGSSVRYGMQPLLMKRVKTAVDYANKHDATLIMSGGKGADEPKSEAEMMSEYAQSLGFPKDRILLEDRSTNTDENLRYSAQIIMTTERHNSKMRVAVVTSNYHAFRAALEMRSQHLPGYAIGAPVSSYYWPSAFLREYVAIMRDYWVVNLVGLFFSSIPFLLSLTVFITRG
ncbi:hypothetical protein BSR28_01380 [Boudabousia liubingyangii]|uniref:YdcF family protein n=1 Tax=Boudabousia liubingyangii TaxID=1921764 RepID=UPI000939DD5D|nr:YdcF family protein [Boudabousia liubingyangii]OKL48382.1 hypothetical protein BSR28_01380 [Boudabousia liubingyangii]